MAKFLFSLVLCFSLLFVPAFSFGGINDQIEEEMLEKCTNVTASSVRAEQMVKAALTTKKYCEDNVITAEEYLDDVRRAARNGDTMASVFNSYCNKAEQYFVCNREFYETLNMCLDKEGLEEVAEYTSLYRATKTYICSDQGRLLERFGENKGFQCFTEKVGRITGCLDVKETDDLGNSTKGDMCIFFSSVEKCAMPIFKECPGGNTPIFQGLFNEVVHKHLCGLNGVDTNRLSQLVILLSIFLYSFFKF